MQANEITLYELEERLNLQVATDSNFFTEWLEPIPLSEEEKAKCDRIRNQFMRQVLYRRKTIEVLVKMLVLSPLLDIAGFYQDPLIFLLKILLSLTKKTIMSLCVVG